LSSVLPTGFELYQNFPNPFNPSTAISFDLPKEAKVSLVVYNLLGQEIRQLVEAQLTAGHHAVTWDGKDGGGNAVSSGIYLYRLTTADYAAQKKMILIK
jgi:flagellar hook assembly protein FlgD